MKATVESIAAKASAYEGEQHQYLRQRGWEYTSSIVGGLWTWVKELPDGKMVVTNTNFAIKIQEIAEARDWG